MTWATSIEDETGTPRAMSKEGITYSGGVVLSECRYRKQINLVVTILALVLMVSISAAAQGAARQVKSKITPVYPDLAKRVKVSGLVKLQVSIARNGSVKDVNVLGGHPLLAEAAVNAVKKWKYEAAAEESTVIVEFRFDEKQVVS